MNATKLPLLVAILCFFPAWSVWAAPHTPQTGSEERKSICDAVRARVLSQAFRKLPQAIVFNVAYLRVDDGFAWFEGTPRFKDESYVSTDFLPDVDYVMVVQKTNSGWSVRQDLSRSDVPSDAEANQLRAQLANIPASIVPDSWRRILNK